jgi:hypothetical protein
MLPTTEGFHLFAAFSRSVLAVKICCFLSQRNICWTHLILAIFILLSVRMPMNALLVCL